MPIKRDFTQLQPALEQKRRITAVLDKMDRTGYRTVFLEEVVENGIVWDVTQVHKVVNFLRDCSVDGVFLFHCDFGNEVAAGRIAKALEVPVLLWGPHDDPPDPVTGKRTRDTQCGLFATSKVLQRFGVPFSYIVNCRVGDPVFTSGFHDFVRTVSVVKAFNSTRIMQVGTRPKSFMSVMCNEADLLRRFGVEVVPVSLSELQSTMDSMEKESREVVESTLSDIVSRIDTSSIKNDTMNTIVRLELAMAKLMKQYECNGAAVECWSLMPGLFGVNPCFANSELTGLGYPVACETDVHGAVTAVLLQAASLGENPTFFADLTMRHPTNDNAELLWHCGPFPYVLKLDESPAALIDCHGEWRLKDGTITIARFDELNGAYSLIAGEGRTVEGPKTEGTYVWIEVDDWSSWEKRFIHGPYIHHVVGVYGQFTGILKDAAGYIPQLDMETL